jgi:Rps23 Pro-64 3,4-dihydroxylase Tpa1-like proline 4-hydroxylase
MHDRTVEFRNLLAGKVNLRENIEDLRASYKAAKPFPHLIIDNLFVEGLLDSLLTEISQMLPEQWLNIGQDTRERTARMRSAAEMSTAGNQLLSIVHSAGFLYLLSEITGISQLLPDPYLQGAGYALMRRGDYFSVHADRNVAYETGLTRRLAMIIFLNKSWSTEYHGQLELWSDDAKRCEATIEPLFNRTIIFEVAYPNFHGVPAPLACPKDRVRQSFITYYHTAGTNILGDVKPHTSIFAPRFYGSNRVTLRSIVRDLTPPLLSRAIRRLSKFD